MELHIPWLGDAGRIDVTIDSSHDLTANGIMSVTDSLKYFYWAKY